MESPENAEDVVLGLWVPGESWMLIIGMLSCFYTFEDRRSVHFTSNNGLFHFENFLLRYV